VNMENSVNDNPNTEKPVTLDTIFVMLQKIDNRLTQIEKK